MAGRGAAWGKTFSGVICALLVSFAGGGWAQEASLPAGEGDAPAGQTQPIPAQTSSQPTAGQVRSPVLTIDTDRLFSESEFGQRVLAELSVATDALAAENRRIEAELTAEEQSLTEQRPGMEVAAFREAANAFDAKVQRIRVEQDAKERALQQRLSAGQDTFLNAATPILGQLMIERGAAVILDRRTVLLAVGFVDVTDAAIAAIDAEIGDGG